MAEITEERLREIASSDPLVLAICATLGEPSWANVRAIAAELLAARADLRDAMELLRAHGEPPDWLRRAWLRGDPGDNTTPFHTWTRRYGALLEKHKETP